MFKHIEKQTLQIVRNAVWFHRDEIRKFCAWARQMETPQSRDRMLQKARQHAAAIRVELRALRDEEERVAELVELTQRAIPKVGNRYVTVCAWCWPGESVFGRYPELRGAVISHTVCPACLDKQMKALEANAGLLK